jgi:lysophospholipase L1-like esterase
MKITMKINLLMLLSFISASIMGQEIKENILDNRVYIERMAVFKANPLVKGQIVFLGNSLTQGGKWNEYFPEQNTANRGIAGDNVLGILGRLSEIIEAKPAKLFIMTGINDISLNRPTGKIMTGIEAIVYQIQAGSPDTQIYMQSPLPMNKDLCKFVRMKGKEKQIEGLYKAIRKFCKKESITFIDLYPFFLDGKRTLDSRYTTDGLHLNDEGYAVWKELLQPYIY